MSSSCDRNKDPLDGLSETEALMYVENCKSTTELDNLSNNPDMRTRRATARNINTRTETLNKLAFDPTANVSYMAMQNRKCKVKRNGFLECHDGKCIVCTVKESDSITACLKC